VPGRAGLALRFVSARAFACAPVAATAVLGMTGIEAAFSLLWAPFAASVAFVLIHSYFGIHVLRRNVVFADLALSQLAALGATIAFAIGYPPLSMAGFAYAFLFTLLGAVLLTLSRRVAAFVSQEAFVGVLYVMATASTVLVVDRAPQGAEHVKKILTGSILTVSPQELLKFVAIYSAIGFLHFLARRPLLALSENASPLHRGAIGVLLWDFFFFITFGAVVTSSVGTAGVLLVFCFLIVPAVIGSLFSKRAGTVLAVAWAAGIAASAAGLAASFMLDLPAGAAMVAAFGVSLVVAGLAKALFFVDAAARRKNRRGAAELAIGSALASILLSGAWLMANPAADQPMIAAIESAAGLSPADFLSESGRAAYESAAQDATRFQAEFDRLGGKERAARYGAAPLDDDEVRRIGSYQQSFSEMARGELFVLGVLREKARRRERWVLGLPLCAASLLGLFLVFGRRRYWGSEPSDRDMD
jgi:zinc/manganese transport system permease protein